MSKHMRYPGGDPENGPAMPVRERCEDCDDLGFLLVTVPKEGRVRIERCDACERFKDDTAANIRIFALALHAISLDPRTGDPNVEID